MNDSPKLARPTMSLDLSDTEDERGEVGCQMMETTHNTTVIANYNSRTSCIEYTCLDFL